MSASSSADNTAEVGDRSAASVTFTAATPYSTRLLPSTGDSTRSATWVDRGWAVMSHSRNRR